MKEQQKVIFNIAVIALFAAIVCIGCYISIPLGIVPIVLQNALCILTSAILGSFMGGAPTALFLLAGAVGLPVYSGGSGGIACWLGPTGGFFWGYLLGAFVTGFIAGKPSIAEKKFSLKTAVRVSLAIVAGMVILYVPGLLHFARWATGSSKIPEGKSVFAYTMGACCLPFIPGDILKIIVSIPVALKVRPVLAQYLYSSVKAKKENVNE